MPPDQPDSEAAGKLRSLRQRLEEQEARRLSPRACLSRQALRRRPEPLVEAGHRLAFAVDADRVLHSLAYTRYIDKTQVFSLLDNDHISHRVLHVQLVSKIARTMGRLLDLNQDLIEAVALAHDIGHPPFGHDGESFLSEVCQEHGLPPFQHNVQSVRFLEELEKGGQGLNLSLQVLDGVLAHDGEVHTARLAPAHGKDFAAFDAELAAREADPDRPVVPMTLEGCLVRITDTVAYIGRDLEDAIIVGLIKRSDIPDQAARELGRSNGTIVYRLVEDLVANSLDQDYLAFSPAKAAALKSLKEFNLERIYTNPAIKAEHPKVRAIFAHLFAALRRDLEEERRDSPIWRDFLDGLGSRFMAQRSPAALVRDFIASMTDEYFLRLWRQISWPGRLPPRFGPTRA